MEACQAQVFEISICMHDRMLEEMIEIDSIAWEAPRTIVSVAPGFATITNTLCLDREILCVSPTILEVL